MILRRFIAGVALLCALAAPACAQPYTKAQLNAQIGVSFPDQNAGFVTPADMRTQIDNIINSILPTAPVVSNDLACFDGTTGLLKDCTAAITGPLTVTSLTVTGAGGNSSFGPGGTGGAATQITLSGESGANGGVVFAFQKNATVNWYLGDRSTFAGGSVTDWGLFNAAGPGCTNAIDVSLSSSLVSFCGGISSSGASTITSASASALAVGLNGATNPVWDVDASTALQVAGLKLKGDVTGGTVSLTVTDSGSNANLSINAKGTGTIPIGNVSSGQVQIGGGGGGLLVSNSFTATALVTNADLATMLTNTIKGNATSGAASPTDLAIGSCSTASSALIWTTNTGFGCNTSITANAVPGTGLTGTTVGGASSTGLASTILSSSLTSLGTIAALIATNATVNSTLNVNNITGISGSTIITAPTSQSIELTVSGGPILLLQSTELFTFTDVGIALGDASHRFNGIFSNSATISGVATLASTTATPAGGSTTARLLFGTTSGFGIYYGSGLPTVSAAQGSIYIRSDGSSTSTRLYVNTTGSTTWTNFTSASWLLKRDLDPASNDNTPAFLEKVA